MVTYLHLISRLRTGGAIPPLSLLPSWRVQGLYHNSKCQADQRLLFVLQNVKARAAESVPQQGGHYESELQFQLLQSEFGALVQSFLQLLVPQRVLALGEY
jgi:hypothetical protein